MPSRERRLLDKNIEIRKLQSELKHYKTQFFVAVVEKDKMQKALDVAVDALKWINETYELGMGYEAEIKGKCESAIEQIESITKGGKDGQSK